MKTGTINQTTEGSVMKMINFFRVILFFLLNLFTLNTFAWIHSIELGYGFSHDPNHTQFNNSGVLLTGDVWPLKITYQTHWSLNGAIGQWYTTAPQHKNLTTAALSLALRYYPLTIECDYPAYLFGSVGPAILSSKNFGMNKQGSNLTFQFNAGLGVEINQIDINLRLSNFSNASLSRPDQGFTVLYLLSIGYLF